MQYFPLSKEYEYFFLHSWKVVPVLKVKIVFCVRVWLYVHTFSSATCDEMCHIRLSLRNFIPYGPNSSDRERISVKTHKDLQKLQ